MFREISSKVSFPQMEEEIIQLWKERNIFKKSLEIRESSKEFVFYDGPPFATGLPHYGHLLAGTIKDIIPRYQAMRGHYVSRRFGWDCHGLPIEALAQEALGLAGAPAIQEAGVDVFNEQCRSMVTKYVEEWEKTVTRMGRWVDFENDYKTMDKPFMETIWWVFSELWKQDRIYKAHRIMPYSWKLNTPLSNFEAGRNYQDVQDPAITVRVKLLDFEFENASALIWTTTPWTLPSNLAICAGPDIDYVAIKDKETHEIFVLAEARLSAYYKKEEEYEILKTFKGSELKGLKYEPIFDFFSDNPNSFQVLNDDFVSTEDGTGIVHMAPAYGEDDYRICRAVDIPLIDPLDEDCVFTSRVPDYEGQFCKDADKAIIKALKHSGKLIHQSTIQHSYPFCERTDTPLIYRAIDAWYVRVEDLREKMLANNSGVHWMPDYVGEKRFANWLADAKDWNISRNRFWGSCIPVWVNIEDKSDMICISSIEQLEELSGEKVEDLHKHYVDEIVIEKDGKTYKRTPEVLDCWFESGSMPYAQNHYPFENKAHFEANFPADFIAEGLDQTRGWFYTLMVLSTALFDKPAFKNVVVNGLVLAEDGLKMSKRLKNYPDPIHVINEYGADALRLYMIYSPVVRAESLRFSEEGVKHSLRHLLLPWWNAYSFFVTYANIDGWTPAQSVPERDNLMDRWIQSSLARLQQQVTEAMDRYDLQASVRPFVAFIEDLTNWYIRRSRRRFWKTEDDTDKVQAYSTLYDVLLGLCKIAAPFTPFISETIYQNLKTEDMPESVHLNDFPTAADAKRDEVLEGQMAMVMSAVEQGRTLRAEYKLKNRQPLAKMHVVCDDPNLLANIQALESLISDELNVRAVEFGTDSSELATIQAKPNFKQLGPKLGPLMKKAVPLINSLTDEQIAQISGGETVAVELEGQTVELTSADIEIVRNPKEGMAVSAEGALVVGLDTQLNDDLIAEGLAREFVNKVQNLRKEMDLEITQRIHVAFSSDEEVAEAVAGHRAYIAGETLALSCEIAENGVENGTELDLNGHACAVSITTAE
ncbi:isoleucine--tRNA ligase [Pontiella agarivorans]|uniref:Isoleucine--tRNA ligase n=1 Tax=Pontiella agarivorans TaxID=3038953 RepID=A0ABU5N034_9BACT|nr:isoleucine--tRNA ligase [Pontiella agarivorans]MDZ8119805.1 isoleucine--tRNA ligase [Pontiella agarivorans]